VSYNVTTLISYVKPVVTVGIGMTVVSLFS